jgi:hypothetical protein
MKETVQKTIRITLILSLIVIGLLVSNVVRAQQKFILSVTEFTVKPGHEMQFEEGVKAWKACYLENKGEWTWTFWRRYNGKGSVYLLASMSQKWAEMDKTDEAGKKCWQVAMDKIIPHVECSEDNFATSIPEFSRTGAADWNIIWVSFFRVENSVLFREIIKEISEVMQKAEGDKRGTWYAASGGGPGSANFYVSTPFKDFAALDVERDGVWKLVENAKGKEYSDKLRTDFRSSVEDSWAYLYKRLDDLSNNPAQ